MAIDPASNAVDRGQSNPGLDHSPDQSQERPARLGFTAAPDLRESLDHRCVRVQASLHMRLQALQLALEVHCLLVVAALYASLEAHGNDHTAADCDDPGERQG